MVAAGFFLFAPAAEAWNDCLLHKDNDDMKTGKEPAFCRKKKSRLIVYKIKQSADNIEKNRKKHTFSIAFVSK